MPGALMLINGFPGVGKHTVAHELVRILPECKFFDTRALVSAASQLYDEGDPAHGRLRKNLQHAVLDSIAQASPTRTTPTAPPPPTYILTDFLSVAARPADRESMHELIAFAQRADFAFIHLILTCGTEENVHRLEEPARRAELDGQGVVEGERLVQIRMEEEIGHIGPRAGLSGEYEIETTGMEARAAASVLAEYCLDTLRSQGWWIQLSPGKGGKGGNSGSSKGWIGGATEGDEESDKLGSLRANTTASKRASLNPSLHSPRTGADTTTPKSIATPAATSVPTRTKLVSFSRGKKKT